MDHKTPIERDFEVDLESGVRSGLEDACNDPISGAKLQEKESLTIYFCGGVANFNSISTENLKVEGEKTVDQKGAKDKHKKGSNKKPPKPPRPPRPLSLDAADQKLIKEIAQLAMLKRARFERMKAMKKVKAAKASSSSSNVFAMLFTILFCLVIIFQGMSSRATSVNIQGSPLPGATKEGGLISVQYFWNPSASEPNGPFSASPNSVETIAGPEHSENLRRGAS